MQQPTQQKKGPQIAWTLPSNTSKASLTRLEKPLARPKTCPLDLSLCLVGTPFDDAFLPEFNALFRQA
jgi:hypothetical protein